MSTPDAITPVEGYRAWRWDGSKLCPTNVGLPWVPGVNEAFCYYNSDYSPRRVRRNIGSKVKRIIIDDHALIPDENCNCGLWFLHSLDEVIERLPTVSSPSTGAWSPIHLARPVYGKVKGWGKVLVGKQGHRSEFAEILCLYAPDDDPEWGAAVEQAAEAYSVPVEITPRVNGSAGTPDISITSNMISGGVIHGGQIYVHANVPTSSQITLPESGASHVERSRDPHGLIYGTALVAAVFVLVAILNAGMS